jgi:hypothetical protein
MHPSQVAGLRGRGGGQTSATGFPNRVISTGFRVRPTRFRTARQVALNLEIGIVSTFRLPSLSRV